MGSLRGSFLATDVYCSLRQMFVICPTTTPMCEWKQLDATAALKRSRSILAGLSSIRSSQTTSWYLLVATVVEGGMVGSRSNELIDDLRSMINKQWSEIDLMLWCIPDWVIDEYRNGFIQNVGREIVIENNHDASNDLRLWRFVHFTTQRRVLFC